MRIPRIVKIGLAFYGGYILGDRIAARIMDKNRDRIDRYVALRLTKKFEEWLRGDEKKPVIDADWRPAD